MSGKVLKWIERWLVNNTKKSLAGSLLSGVPQGSVLGLVQFLEFIKNL